jgi:hypothetical protein
MNRKMFMKAYGDAISGCNDCHSASDKPYLLVTIPAQPEARGIDFKPHKH